MPASFVIREYVRPKYACERCQQGVVQAVLPARPIEKGRPGAGVIGARGQHQVRGTYAVLSPVFILMVLLGRVRFANQPSRTSACSSDGRLKRGFRGSVVKILRGSISADPVILLWSFEKSRTMLLDLSIRYKRLHPVTNDVKHPVDRMRSRCQTGAGACDTAGGCLAFAGDHQPRAARRDRDRRLGLVMLDSRSSLITRRL
jgi:hypothetical protein